MNVKALEALAGRLDGMETPELIGDTEGEGRYRTNDPTGDHQRRTDEADEGVIERIAADPPALLHIGIGYGRENGRVIGGLASLLIGLDPEGALAERDRRRAKNRQPTLQDIGMALTGLEAPWNHILLNGPNWAGDLAGWITPGEAARAVRNVLAGKAAGSIWQHVSADMLKKLEETYLPTEGARGVGARRHGMQRAEQSSAVDRGAVREAATSEERERLNELYKSTDIDPDARIDPTARIDDEVTIGSGAEIGANCHVERGAIVGCNVRIGPGSRVGAGAHIEQESKIGPRVRIGERAMIGEHTEMEEGVAVGNQAVTGARTTLRENATVDNHATLEAETTVGEQAHVGAGSRIGTGCAIGPNTWIGAHGRIGERARVEGVRIDERHAVPGGAVITDDCGAARYALRIRPPEGGAE